MPTPACHTCQKRRMGRYTRKQGDTIPYFYCFTCVPEGKGADETAVPPAKKLLPTPRVNVEATKEEGLSLVEDLRESLSGFQVETAEDFEAADVLLSKVTKARRTWKGRMEGVIRPIRQGLDALYELNREVDKPLETMEKTIRRGMADFKLEEARLLAEATAQKEAEEERLRQEAEERRLAAERAATPQMRGRLEAAASRAEAKADEVATQSTPLPTIAEHSTSRPVKRVRVVDMVALCKGVGEGYAPVEVVVVSQVALNRLLKDDPDMVAAMPGVEVYDDVEIVRR